jgi:hypothetical protein
MAERRIPKGVRTIAECDKCKRALSLLSPQDVAKRIDALLEQQKPWHELSEPNRFGRSDHNSARLIELRVELRCLAAHLRGVCVTCTIGYEPERRAP